MMLVYRISRTIVYFFKKATNFVPYSASIDPCDQFLRRSSKTWVSRRHFGTQDITAIDSDFLGPPQNFFVN